jgi:DNA-binding transcriptional regulator YiaG
MDKRLAKRHKRQVERAKQHVKLSEPDLRTPEEIEAAREKSQAHQNRAAQLKSGGSASAVRGGPMKTTGSAAKTDV